MGFIAQVFSLFRRLGDVNWSTVTAATPFLKYNSSTDKIEGAAEPAGGGGGADTRLVSGTADGQLARWESATGKYEPYNHITVADNGNVTIKNPLSGDTAFNFDLTSGHPQFRTYYIGGNPSNSIGNDVVSSGIFDLGGHRGQFRFNGLTIKSSSGIYWSSTENASDGPNDVSLERVGAGRLRITGVNTSTLGGVVQNGLHASSTAATSTGTITKRVAAYDEAGTLIGYIPVYDSL
jgi:hypothetical protein